MRKSRGDQSTSCSIYLYCGLPVISFSLNVPLEKRSNVHYDLLTFPLKCPVPISEMFEIVDRQGQIKKISVFRIACLKILGRVGQQGFFWKKKIILCILKGILPFKIS